MDFDQLRQLVAVSEAGTMSSAAQAAHITQPSLSRSMHRLEAVLGCELFDRTRNSATLNEAATLPWSMRATSLPPNSAFATFLVMNVIGFWKDVYEQGIPDAHSIVQRDREVFMQLIASSEILHFTTDAPQNSSRVPGRVAVPIADASAHATFFLVALKTAPARVCKIVDWVKKTSD